MVCMVTTTNTGVCSQADAGASSSPPPLHLVTCMALTGAEKDVRELVVWELAVGAHAADEAPPRATVSTQHNRRQQAGSGLNIG